MNGLLSGFTALRHRNYQIYYAGQSVSLIGTGMQTVAQAWLVLKLTDSAAALGIVAALQALPMLVVAWFAGAYIDRFSKRALLFGTQTAMMLLAFVLGTLVVTGTVQVWHVYVLAMLLGVANAIDSPTRHSFLIEMVGRPDLMNAVSLNSMMFNLGRITGPAIGGVLIGLVGVTSSFFLNGVSFLSVLGALLLMRTDRFFPKEASHGPQLSILRSLAEGFRYARRTPVARSIIVLAAVLAVFTFNTNVLLPLFAQDVLKVGPSGLGAFFSAMGAGSVIATLIAAFTKQARWSRIFIGALGMGAFEVAFAFSRSFPLSVLLMLFVGISMHTFFTSANTGIQQRVPDALRGRVTGIYFTASQGTTPIGNVMSGALASAFGAPAAMIIGGVAGLIGLSALGGWMFARKGTSDLRLVADEPAQEPAAAVAPVPSAARAAG